MAEWGEKGKRKEQGGEVGRGKRKNGTKEKEECSKRGQMDRREEEEREQKLVSEIRFN